MGGYEQLKEAVRNVIKANGNQEITGDILQQTLVAIINNMAQCATFAGVATPDTVPGTPDGNVFYLAAMPGTYVNFGGIIVSGRLTIITNKGGVWSNTELDIPNYAEFSKVRDAQVVKRQGIRIMSVNNTAEIGHLDSTAGGRQPTKPDVELENTAGGDVNIKGAGVHVTVADTFKVSQTKGTGVTASTSSITLDGDVHITTGSGGVKVDSESAVAINSNKGDGIKLRLSDILSLALERMNDRLNIVAPQIRWVQKVQDKSTGQWSDVQHLLSEELLTPQEKQDLKNCITRIFWDSSSEMYMYDTMDKPDNDFPIQEVAANGSKPGLMSVADKKRLENLIINSIIDVATARVNADTYKWMTQDEFSEATKELDYDKYVVLARFRGMVLWASTVAGSAPEADATATMKLYANGKIDVSVISDTGLVE
ncbi:MAG: hypothetical protein NC344_06915 [Bacteroidales bacterium]|nr:hypothetical protein [Bacteroidales bacterium]MCM1147548.1 hypothetical protein [Bacteroidales bacterium]MCM1206338.1 hypothetical protein [Bacillota bacterium]MCM1511233.1 hypothetical protein [Clostridium sp.]